MRYQNAADLRADLKRLKRDMDSSRHSATSLVTDARSPDSASPRLHKFIYACATLLALFALVVASRWFMPSVHRGSKPMTERQLTLNSVENRVTWSAISPDGRSLAYTDNKGVHISSIETGESHDFSLPPELQHQVHGVLWFPDGNNLLLGGGEGDRGSIWTVSIFGGNPRLVKSPIGKLALSAQGTSIAYLDKDGHQLWVMNANGDNARMVLEIRDEQIGALASVSRWSPPCLYCLQGHQNYLHDLLSGGTPPWSFRI